MTDVRLTATNPEDSSVVPVACNSRGELLIVEPVFEEIPNDVSFDGDVEISGELSVGSSALFQASSFAGDVTFSKDVSINAVTVGIGAGAIDTNTAVGRDALSGNTSGSNNTAVGRNALASNASGGSNTAVGNSSLRNNIDGTDNTAVGVNALSGNTEGTQNTAVGIGTLSNNSQGSQNTAVGRNSLSGNTSGPNNTAVGRNSLSGNTSGSNNTAVGHMSLFSNSTGTQNTAFGQNAGYGIDGDANTFIGRYQGMSGLSNTLSLSTGQTERMRISADDSVDFNQKCGFTADGGLWITDTRGNTLRTTFQSNGFMAWEEVTIQRRNEPQLTEAQIEALANS